MGLLWLVTLIWAFSFSLIGEFLSGRVDPYLAVSSRMLLALVLFLPWLLKSTSSKTQAMALAGIGAVQLGLMYLLLYHSFLYLTVAEVLLFTILTPAYISILDYFWRYKKLHL
ncbi:EamA family transporter, partial [uncultured Rheinheimera sp.]